MVKNVKMVKWGVAGLVMIAASVVGLSGQGVTGADWSQWRGPDRSGRSTETGLLDEWPADGPLRVWSVSNVGVGVGSVAVRDDRLFVQGIQDGQSAVSALRRADGTRIWMKTLGASGQNREGSGPRGTPTVDGDRLYALTENGDLACLRVEDGRVLWQRNILTDFRGRNPAWMISESPLVDGDQVIVAPGGRGAGMVALDKMTGDTLWVAKELSDQAGYASPIVADVGGVRTVMTLTAAAGVGVRASDGKLMWRHRAAANRTANITTPIFHDNKVFYSASYGAGGTLLGLHAEGDDVVAQEIYRTRDMQNHHGGIVLVDDYLYGFNNSILTCLEFATGKLMWRHRSVGKGSLSYADGHLYILSENDVAGLVEATPEGYREQGRFRVAAGRGAPTRAHPTISRGRLYLRNQGTLGAYNIQAQ
jgi:outer membrane protein assembly factor BamB